MLIIGRAQLAHQASRIGTRAVGEKGAFHNQPPSCRNHSHKLRPLRTPSLITLPPAVADQKRTQSPQNHTQVSILALPAPPQTITLFLSAREPNCSLRGTRHDQMLIMAKPLPAPASNMASNSRSLTPALPQASGCAARSACRAPTRRCAAPATATPAPAGRPARSRSALSVSAVVSPPVVVRPSPPPEPRVETHDYSMAGPYSPSVLLQRIQLKTMDGKNSFNVNMRITYPADAAPGAAFPLVAFFNGFEVSV